MRMHFYLIVAMMLPITGCSQNPSTTGGSELLQQQQILAPAEFQVAIDNGNAVLVDVRTPQEYASGHIPGSINLDWTAPDYEQRFAGLDRERPVLVYCAIGGRSDQARAYLQEKGYQVIELEDGIASWKKAGLPLERN